MNAKFLAGNAEIVGEARGGWFVGHFMDEVEHLTFTTAVEVKWGVHPSGQRRRAPAQNQSARTLSVLIRGRFHVVFTDGSVVLSREGDYVVWGEGVAHEWWAEHDSVVLTVRWPSLSADSVDLAPNIDTRENP